MNNKTMKENLVRFSHDFENPPPLTAEQKSELEALRNKPDDEIDYSDIPPLTEDFWKNAKRGLFFRARKESTTIRLDADILAWLKSAGPGYQTRINAILREAMSKVEKK